MMPYTIEDIRDTVSPTFFSRGKNYFKTGRVRKAEFSSDGQFLTGDVAGTAPRPYKVVIEIGRLKNGRTELFGDCTCPVSFNCKHVAAVLLAGLELEEAEAPEDEGNIRDLQVAGWLRDIEALVTPANDHSVNAKKRLLYLLNIKNSSNRYNVTVNTVSINILKDGSFGKTTAYNATNVVDYRPAKFLYQEDIEIIKRLLTHHSDAYYKRHINEFSLDGNEGARLLEEMLATGRCYWQGPGNSTITLGEERQGRLGWDMAPDGTQRIACEVDEGAVHVFSLIPLYYLDLTKNSCGKLNTGVPAELAKRLLQAPPLKPAEIEVVRKKLSSHLKDTNVELPRTFDKVETDRKITPVPHLYLTSAVMSGISWRYDIGQNCPTARLSFYYDDTKVNCGDNSPQITMVDGDKLVCIKRKESFEKSKADLLKKHGFTSIQKMSYVSIINKENVNDFVIRNKHGGADVVGDVEDNWLRFICDTVPKLRKEGWRVEVDPDFPFNIVEPDDEWYTEVDESRGIDWFGVELGVMLEGERLNLLPILLNSLKTDPKIFEDLDACTKEEKVLCLLQDGRKLALPSDRIRTILTFLKDLYNFENLDENGNLKFSRLEAADLTELEAAVNMRWFGGERVRQLGQKLRNFTGIIPVAPPMDLKTKLRHYQEEGLNWLQFLREYELAGILADDMGLGKTVQTLAHLALEKENNRLDKPALLIAPTSILVNWRLEAERFTPKLKSLTLHGADRKAHYDRIKDHDVVLTTYPLLPRDKDELLKEEYHTIILDEAQYIKNPKAKITQVACQLKARHRLCLTGTPMENHLGELWSLFNFLLPGLLGDERRFRKFYRNPIEKKQDDGRRKALVRRIKPFMLRRTKDKVAAELPPKTEIVQTSELDKSQRDLYETIRVSMHKKVREEIADKGLARSHIIVLDALLKLRQVCCDPRLLSIDAAKKVRDSVKLEQLMEMLPELIEEGRKVLLFSQFVSMLALIEEKLKGHKMEYVMLTGQTKDRQTPIKSFQNGAVPIFLISLKAGGTGLNLTAADTVIHYDPWWNPAVETQATDRAHRIGQDKPVFVYKLITAGTVEEKIIQMQERKRALAEGIFDPESKAAEKLTIEDINALFEPIV